VLGQKGQDIPSGRIAGGFQEIGERVVSFNHADE
jgi:hypothetical protein